MKNIEKKIKIVEEVSDSLKKASSKKGPSTVVVNYSSITANEMSGLRSQLEVAGYKLQIVKNTLIKKVFDKLNIPLSKNLEGQHAILLPKDSDITSAIKTIFKFIKENEKGSVDLGVLDGQVITNEKVEQLSKLPSKEELIAQVLAGFSTPIRGFATTIGGVPAKFARVINAIKEQKE